MQLKHLKNMPADNPAFNKFAIDKLFTVEDIPTLKIQIKKEEKEAKYEDSCDKSHNDDHDHNKSHEHKSESESEESKKISESMREDFSNKFDHDKLLEVSKVMVNLYI